jgi:transcriptional antiterminator
MAGNLKTMKELARLYGLSEKTIKNYAVQHSIKQLKKGRVVYYAIEDFKTVLGDYESYSNPTSPTDRAILKLAESISEQTKVLREQLNVKDNQIHSLIQKIPDSK